MRNIIVLFLILITYSLYSQEKGVFSGAFETNANVFIRDSAINAINAGGSLYINANLSDDRYSCMKDLENFLAEKLRERCREEINALLPQPIAEEIVEQF